MATTHTQSGSVFLSTMAALTVLPGLWAIAHAPASGLGTDVMNGVDQRLYEARFEESFPKRAAMTEAWSAFKYGALGELAEGGVAGRGGVLFTAEEFKTPSPHPNFAKALIAARDQISSAGGELIPVIVPDKARMMPEALRRGRSAHFEQRYDTLLQIITSLDLRTVDVRTALARPGSFMRTDTHWSPSGAQAAASGIAALLSGDVDGAVAFETARTGAQDFHGDLLAFANTGRFRPLAGPAPEQIETFETENSAPGGLGLFDEIDTPAVLVGTSFSARDDFHFLGFLKSALRADVVSFAMEGHGPFLPMQRFLEGSALGDASPKFVIWEIPERYLDTWSQTQ